jgi:hypothetical protein
MAASVCCQAPAAYKSNEQTGPNPDKPEPKLTVKTKKEPKKIEFGTRFDKAHRIQELTKVKTKFS